MARHGVAVAAARAGAVRRLNAAIAEAPGAFPVAVMALAGEVDQGTGSFSTSTSATPGGSASAPRIEVPSQSGKAIATYDFIHNGETAADVENPGSYVLAGSMSYCLADGTCPSGAERPEFGSGSPGFRRATTVTCPVGAAGIASGSG